MKLQNDTTYKPLDSFEVDLEKAIDNTDKYTRPKNYKAILADAVIAANNTSAKSKQ